MLVCTTGDNLERKTDYMTLGRRIRQRRKELKITQQDLAVALGLTAQHISAIEQDKRTASLAALLRLAEEPGVALEYLTVGKEGVITDTIPAIRADKKLSLEAKRALITLVRQLYG